MGIVISRVFQKGSYLLTSVILARLLGPEGRGLVSALLVPSSLAVNFSEMGIRQATAYHVGRGLYPLGRIVPTLLALVPITSAIGILLSLAYFAYSGVARDDLTIQLLAVAAIPLSLASSYATGVFLGRGRVAAFRKTSWRPALVRLLLILLLGWALGWGAHGVMVANLAASFAGAAYALHLLARETPLRLKLDREVATKLQRQGASYAASLLVLTMNYRVMILLIARFSTLREVGLYAQAIAVAELIWEVPNALSSLVLSRSVTAQDSEIFSRKVHVMARLSVQAAALVGAALAIASPLLFPLAFGHRFAESSRVCNILMPGIVAFVFFKALNTDLSGRGKPLAAFAIMLPVLLCSIAVGSVAIKRAGAEGAAVTSSIAYVFATIIYVVIYSRVTGFDMLSIILPRAKDYATLRDRLRKLLIRRNDG